MDADCCRPPACSTFTCVSLHTGFRSRFCLRLRVFRAHDHFFDDTRTFPDHRFFHGLAHFDFHILEARMSSASVAGRSTGRRSTFARSTRHYNRFLNRVLPPYGCNSDAAFFGSPLADL